MEHLVIETRDKTFSKTDRLFLLQGTSVISFHTPTPPPPPGGTASSFSSQMTNSWGQGCLNSQAPAKEIKIGGQMDGAVGIDLCIRKSSSLSICPFGWDGLNNLITHIQVRHSIKICTQFQNSSRSYQEITIVKLTELFVSTHSTICITYSLLSNNF